MAIITDLAAKKAYLLGQLTEVDGAESSLYRNRQIRKLWKEFTQVDKQLNEAYAEAEAKKSQSPVPVESVQEGTDPAAQTVSEDEADNATSDHSSPDKIAASSSEPTSRAAQRKVAFQLPEASDHDSHSETPETSSTTSSIELNRDIIDSINIEDEKVWYHRLMARRQKLERVENDGKDASDYGSHSETSETGSTGTIIELNRDLNDSIDMDDGEALHQSLMARRQKFLLENASDYGSHSKTSETNSTNSSIELNEDPPKPIDSDDEEAWYQYLRARREKLNRLVNDGNYAADHFVPPPSMGSQDEMEGSRVSAESQEQDSS